MVVSDFRIVTSCTPSNTILYGSTATISFKVRREAADRFNNGLCVWYNTGYGEALAYMNTAFSLNVGETAEIEVKSGAFSGTEMDIYLETNRALQVESWAVQFGVFGARTDVVFATNIVRGWIPRIINLSVARQEDGALSDEGEGLMCSLKLSVSGYADTSEMGLHVFYDDYSTPIDLSASIPDAITGIVSSTTLITRTFSNGSNWTLRFVFGDMYEGVVGYVSIPRAFANVHLSGCSTGGVAFGKFSSATEGEPKFECEYLSVFNAGIVGVTDYETGEVKTGGKFGGKDIYRAIFVKDNVSGNQHEIIGSLPEGTAVDTVLGIYGSMKNNSTGEWRNVPLLDPEAGLGYSMQYYLDGQYVKVQDGESIRSISKKCIAIILYTKGGGN